MNLIHAIKAIETEMAEIKAKHRMELLPYENSLKELRKINTACEYCAGEGKVFQEDYHTCEVCNGTGKNKNV